MFTELPRDHRKRSGHRVAAKGDRLMPGSSTEAFAQSMPKHTYVQEYGKAGLFAPLIRRPICPSLIPVRLRRRLNVLIS